MTSLEQLKGNQFRQFGAHQKVLRESKDKLVAINDD
jgi:hypothetical protein